MKLFVVARNKGVVKDYKKEIKKKGFKYGRINPDIVLSLGGDGTYLIAEKMFPGVAKLLIRDSNICNKCSVNLFDAFLDIIMKKKFEIEKHMKLECVFKKRKLIAANDIIIRNKSQQEAIRFKMRLGGKLLDHEFIGDGAVFSTPWGSTGYFSAITKKSFKKGIGIALNNVNSKKREVITGEKSKIEIEITRGKALLTADNQKSAYIMGAGDRAVIKKSVHHARTVKIKKK